MANLKQAVKKLKKDKPVFVHALMGVGYEIALADVLALIEKGE